MNESIKSAYYSLIFIFILAISAIGIVLEREQTSMLALAYFAAFFSYFWLIQFYKSSNSLFALGVVARLLLFLSMPTLSDDIYRFLLDGNLLANGINPYLQTPEYYFQNSILDSEIPIDFYEQLNSKQYYTIYPPLNQLLFWFSVKIGSPNLLFSTNVIRLFILAAEIGSFFILRKILFLKSKDSNLAYWYFLNPLVILEFCGNVHFEAFVILFILFGLFLLEKKKYLSVGLSFGMAIASKLLPLIFLPALLLRYKWKNGLLITLTAFLVVAFSFIPLFSSSFLENTQDSLNLYFQKFEFNASIYFLFREIGFWYTGYNIIGTLGPVLSVVSTLIILAISFYGSFKKWKVEKTALFVLLTYLLLATTVHPWYILALIPLGLLSGHYFPVFWSLMIFATFFGYSKDGFELSAWWIVVEYVGLLTFVYFELFLRKHESID